MAKDLFIDGLKPRQSKNSQLDSLKTNQAHFSSGYVNIEFGNNATTSSSRHEINKLVETTKITKKAPSVVIKQAPRQKSYARDILGVKDEEDFEFDSEDLMREQKERRRVLLLPRFLYLR